VCVCVCACVCVRVCVCVCVCVVQLLMMMGVRKLLDFVFTHSELYWLDHILPGDERIRREDERAKRGLDAVV